MMSKLQLKKYLDTLQAEQLRLLVTDLYESRKDMRDYLEFFMNPDSQKKSEKYRSAIRKEIINRFGYYKRMPRRSKCKKAIAEFLSFSPDPAVAADVMMEYVELVEQAIAAGMNYGGAFEQSVAGTLSDTMRYVSHHGLWQDLAPRIKRLTEGTSHWQSDVHTSLTQLYADLDLV